MHGLPLLCHLNSKIHLWDLVPILPSWPTLLNCLMVLVAFSSLLLYPLYVYLLQNLTALISLWIYLISVGSLRIRNIFIIVIPPAHNLTASYRKISSLNFVEIKKIIFKYYDFYKVYFKFPKILESHIMQICSCETGYIRVISFPISDAQTSGI